MKKYAANLITGSRVLLAIAILWIPVFSIPFYVLYLLCGITDMLDGIIARRTGTASSLGSKLDSMADVVFVMVCLIKILPSLQLEWLAGVWIAAIAFLRMVNIIFGYVYRHQLILLHTIANKVTGFLLFLLPFRKGTISEPDSITKRKWNHEKNDEQAGVLAKPINEIDCKLKNRRYRFP